MSSGKSYFAINILTIVLLNQGMLVGDNLLFVRLKAYKIFLKKLFILNRLFKLQQIYVCKVDFCHFVCYRTCVVAEKIVIGDGLIDNIILVIVENLIKRKKKQLQSWKISQKA